VNIRTNWQYMHWVAVDDDTYDGPDSSLGMGSTEQEAIEDLREQLAEREERRNEMRS
jgi:hypothetical protein